MAERWQRSDLRPVRPQGEPRNKVLAPRAPHGTMLPRSEMHPPLPELPRLMAMLPQALGAAPSGREFSRRARNASGLKKAKAG